MNVSYPYFERYSGRLTREAAWGGLVSSATYLTGNDGADFGNTFYNDHHFHYGYFIYAAAIIGYLDPSWLTKDNVDYVNTLVRDIANPSPSESGPLTSCDQINDFETTLFPPEAFFQRGF